MNQRLFSSLILVACIAVSACKDMYDISTDFVVPNGLKYPQKADSLKAFSGYNKLRLTWLKPTDPSVIRAEVYSLNSTDTIKIDMLDQPDTISVDVVNVGEGTYNFYVKQFDIHGNESIPMEVTGTSYGPNYLISATDRMLIDASRDSDYYGTIVWGAKTTDLIYSEVRYHTLSGELRTIRIAANETVLHCPDIGPGKLFDYRSVFLPSGGIDTVYRDWITHEKSFTYLYPRAEWTVVSRNGYHPWAEGGGGQPFLVLDGNPNTAWHSSVGSPLPQCLVIDMQQSLHVDKIALQLPAITSWQYLRNIEIYISNHPMDPEDAALSIWGTPAAKRTHTSGDRLEINFNVPAQGRYLAVAFLDSKASTYMNLAELEVFGQ